MATIRKRGKGYQIDYFDPNGKRVRKSFKKKKDAEAELGKRVSLIAESRYLDVKKDYKRALRQQKDSFLKIFVIISEKKRFWQTSDIIMWKHTRTT